MNILKSATRARENHQKHESIISSSVHTHTHTCSKKLVIIMRPSRGASGLNRGEGERAVHLSHAL